MTGLEIGLAGAAIAGQAASAASQSKMNKRTMRYNTMMWNKTNQYNHPKNQMQRLIEAGLNPHLVYGGSSGQTAGTASQPGTPDQSPIDFGSIPQALTGTLGEIYQMKSVKAGTDVQEAQADNVKQDTLNKAIDAVGKTIRNNKENLSYAQKKKLFKTEIDTALANLENINVRTRTTARQDNRAERIANATIPKLQEELNYLRKKGKALNEEVIMRQIDRQLYEQHRVRPNDPAYMRIMTRIMDALDPDSSQLFKRGPLKGLMD